jgi:DNA-directed RNA polymerase subunit RPC12/RpoP
VQGAAGLETTENEQNDVFFKCQHCGTALVVAATAAGMTLKCQRCGSPTTVPHSLSTTPKTCAVHDPELQRRLTENESQRTEITGYINQLNIQLHRWQLRLQTLKEREQKLQAELAAILRPSTE